MRLLKLAIVSIVLLSILILAISFMLPSTVIVRRSIDIDASADTISAKINDLNKWEEWLVNRDSLPIKIAADGDKQKLVMGNTSITMIANNHNEVRTNWQVEKGKVMPCYINLIINKQTPVITLQWQFEQQLKWYPWEKFSAMISDKVLGPFIEQNLHNLKERSEGK